MTSGYNILVGPIQDGTKFSRELWSCKRSSVPILPEGLPEVLGNKGTWPISTGEKGNKGKIFKGTKNVLGNTGTKHSLREDKKLEKKKRRNSHLSCDIFFAPMLHGIAAAVELGY